MNLIMELANASLIFKNFAGAKQRYNDLGNRNVTIKLPHEIAEPMIAAGWPIKFLNPLPNDADQRPTPIIKVKPQYDPNWPQFASKLHLIAGTRMTLLDADTVGQLDTAEILNADIIIRMRTYTTSDGETRRPVYLDEGYFTIKTNRFAQQYAELGY